MAIDMQELTEKINHFDKTYHARSYGNQWQILSPWIKTTALMSSLKALPQKFRTFGLTLALTSKGLFQTNCESGFIGPTLEKIIHGLNSFISKNYLQKTAAGKKKYLLDAISVSLPLAIMGTHYTLKNGFGPFLATEKADVDEERCFSVEVALQMACEAHILQSTFETLTDALELEKQQQKEIAQLLSATAFALVLLTLSSEPTLKLETTIHSFRKHLSLIFKNVSSILEKKHSPEVNPFLIGTQQAHLNLDDGHIETCIEALLNPLEGAGIKKSHLLNEIKELGETTNNMYQACAVDSEELNAITTIYQIG